MPIPGADEPTPDLSSDRLNTAIGSHPVVAGWPADRESSLGSDARHNDDFHNRHHLRPEISIFPSSLSTDRRASSPFRARSARALAAALNLGGSKPPADCTPTHPLEILSSAEQSVDGRPIEVILYRTVMDCPICFLSYPPFLNYTRCCSQPICTECFVQIKRPDPHVPEHHPGSEPQASESDTPDNEEQELVSEPSACPYCQQSELGVTYEPPPFRRGLVYSQPTGTCDYLCVDCYCVHGLSNSPVYSFSCYTILRIILVELPWFSNT